MKKLFAAVLLVASLAVANHANAQVAQFKGLTKNTLVKTSNDSYGTAVALTSGTGTTSSAAVTLNTDSGVITTEALVTAGLADYTCTLTNSNIAATSKIFVSVDNGTNTQGTIADGAVHPGAGSATIKVHNLHATQALNGTLKISFWVIP